MVEHCDFGHLNIVKNRKSRNKVNLKKVGVKIEMLCTVTFGNSSRYKFGGKMSPKVLIFAFCALYCTLKALFLRGVGCSNVLPSVWKNDKWSLVKLAKYHL